MRLLIKNTLVFMSISLLSCCNKLETGSKDNLAINNHMLLAVLIALPIFFFIVSLVQFLAFKQKAIIYYSMYLLSMLFYFIYKCSDYEWFGNSTHWINEHKNQLKSIANFLPYMCYFLFAKHFFNFQKEKPKVAQIIDLVVYGLIGYFFLDHYMFEGNLFYGAAAILAIVSIYAFLQVYRIKDLSAFYILTGTMFYMIGAIVSLFMYKDSSLKITSVWEKDILYDGLGMFIEIICFIIAFMYRVKISEQEKNRLEIAKLIQDQRHEAEKKAIHKDAQENLRMDLHDFLKSALSALKGNANILKRETDVVELQKGYIQAEQTLTLTLHLMDGLIAILAPDQPSIPVLEKIALDHFRSQFDEKRGHSISIDFDQSVPFMDQILPLEVTHTLMAVITEGIHNASKYANREQIIINLGFRLENDTHLIMTLSDNGPGFDVKSTLNNLNQRKGHGLVNLQRRARKSGGAMHIESDIQGTKIIIKLPYSPIN
ncbi:MAG: 7TM diverse intracellular signaling domain-containing protein [Haliscomenobacter sp.]|uniref:sensor histidine kinase n=1 Tax=Haliscomenobacter sp. TaxID=2717303 RepID=UPI0029B91F91|nr:7TM diverse intracellular signaling domain-containing protein [Haliscomenobacter sp.]MDX2072067.1 7TM diverse intracellular signaling domain-containing protein [Haliscomenobacter sp.]